MNISEMPDLLTVKDVANYLRVPISWVYERTRNRSIPIYKIGNHVRVPKLDFICWLEDTDCPKGSKGDV
jgi:excisionase family DNA binding protein